MKKRLIILILLGFSCSVDQGAEPCNPEHNLETNEAIDINANSARFSGSITIISLECPIPGGAQQGFVFDINNSPTVDDTVIIANGTQIDATVTNLSPATTYYVRTFIANSTGAFYGNEINFTTQSVSSN